MLKVGIIGTTVWGITLAVILAEKGIDVGLWARTEKEARKLQKNGPGSDEAPDVVFPPKVIITHNIEEALDEARAVILVVPSQSMRQNIKLIAGHIGKSMLVISAAKGLEIGSGLRMSQVIAEEINHRFHSNICVISGPNLAREILCGRPAATVAAAEDGSVAI